MREIPGLMTALYTGQSVSLAGIRLDLALARWIAAQPNRSITPHALVQKAVQLSNGNVQRGLSYAWNTLCEHWQDAAMRNYSAPAVKLVDITGEFDTYHEAKISERNMKTSDFLSTSKKISWAGENAINIPSPDAKANKSIRGDNFSAWYHFIGTSLLGFHLANRGDTVVGRLGAVAAARTVSAGSVFLEEHVLFPEFVDPTKRVELDKAGYRFGIALAKHLRSQVGRTPSSTGSPLDYYLYSDPRRYRNWALPKGVHPMDFQAKHSRRGQIERRMGTWLRPHITKLAATASEKTAELERVKTRIRAKKTTVRKTVSRIVPKPRAAR
jgi:hypothetical protein